MSGYRQLWNFSHFVVTCLFFGRENKNPELKKSGNFCFYFYAFLSSRLNLLFQHLRLILVPVCPG